jgi:hypothetical protein
MKFTLGFSEQEINTLLKGLGELPAKESMMLILRIKKECETEISKKKEL